MQHSSLEFQLSLASSHTFQGARYGNEETVKDVALPAQVFTSPLTFQDLPKLKSQT